ncbi:hypothetical protein [Aquipuribacter hungaricus]|uniref:Uncharacterized protein n=1 Tax=Aquipuribacter hungaricus TaxID=545624 RepID=A0ABV7WH17_9MICO
MTSPGVPAAPPAWRPPPPPALTGRVVVRTPAEGGLVGVLLGVGLGGLFGVVMALAATMTSVGAGERDDAVATLVLFLMVSTGVGAVVGGVIGLTCGVVAVLAVGLACLVTRAAGRRLSRGAGTLVVPASVLAAPWLVTGAIALGTDGLGDGLQAFVLIGTPALVAEAGVATWRYRVLTRPRDVSHTWGTPHVPEPGQS